EGTFFPASGQELAAPLAAQVRPAPIGGARFSGQVKSLSGTMLLLTLRNGQVVQVDISQALKNHLAVIGYPGMFVMVEGSLSSSAVLTAVQMLRAKQNSANWPPD